MMKMGDASLPWAQSPTQSCTGSTADLANVHSTQQLDDEMPEAGYYSSLNSGMTTPHGEPCQVHGGLRPNNSSGSLPAYCRVSVSCPLTGSSTPRLGMPHQKTVSSLSVLSRNSCSQILSGPNGTSSDFKQNLSAASSALIPICRICHLPEDESDSMLISPCRCAGTMQFIHNSCLMKWLEIKTRKSKKPPKCELCRYQYHRHKKFKFHHWRFPRVSQQDKILHIIFLVNLVIMIACAIATVLCFLSDKGKITKFPRNKVDLTTEEIITLSCGVLFFVSFFIAMSVQIKAKHTIYQLFVKFIMQNMEWEIDEYDKSKDNLYKPSFV